MLEDKGVKVSKARELTNNFVNVIVMQTFKYLTIL